MSSENNVMTCILLSKRTVFTTQSMMMLTEASDAQKLTQSLHYYVRQGRLLNPRRGIYAKVGYDEREMACAVFRPSYISLEYVLGRAGVIFQYDSAVTCVSYLTREIDIDGKTYSFRQIEGSVWAGMDGLLMEDNITIATPERAFLDMVYLSAGNCYFDNLRPLNKSIVKQLIPHYHSKRLEVRAAQLLGL